MPDHKNMRFRWEHALREGDHGLSASAVAVGMMLATWAGADGQKAYPGRGRLGKAVGLKERMVSTHIKSLKEMGWIQEVSGPSSTGSAPVYRLTIPPSRNSTDRP